MESTELAGGSPLNAIRNLRGWPTLCGLCKGWDALALGFRTRLPSSPRIHLQQSLASIIMTPTAPRPIPRMLHQLRFHRIRMHVVQLLRNLRRRIHIQIKITSLPEASQLVVLCRKSERHLSSRCSFSTPHPARHPLLEHLQNCRRFNVVRFTNQQVHVFGHNHVSNQRESVPRANFSQNLHRHISRAHAAQQCSTLIAAKCDEMQMTKPGDAFQTSRHTQRSERPTLCKNQHRKG